MTHMRWPWYLSLVLFYLGLGYFLYSYYTEFQRIQDFEVVEGLDSIFEGNDWITCTDTEKGIIVERVHPLPGYKKTDLLPIKPGDRIEKIDYHDLISAEQLRKITEAKAPTTLISLTVRPYDPYNQIFEKDPIGTIITNGYRLSFSYNILGTYWHLNGWIAGIGAFIALVILVILYPIVRRRILSHLSLLGVVAIAAILFFFQFGRHIYLIVENDLSTITFEKQFFLVFMLLLMGYAVLYLLFKGLGRGKMWFLAIPSMLATGFLFFQTYQVLYVSETLRFYHTLTENTVIEFFLLHLLGGAFLFLTSADKEERRKERISLSLIGILALGVTGYFIFRGDIEDATREHIWFLANLLMFFPLIHASLRQLQFGKVSLVITQSLQYLIVFVLSLILYLLISQVYGYLKLNIEYRRILEFVTFLLVLGFIRLIYNSNEDKLSRYFVSSQQERLAEIKSFIARISQYTSPDTLIEDLKQELQAFFSTDFVEFWWSPENFEAEEDEATDVPQLAGDLPWDRIYHQLAQRKTIWSKTKVISTFRLDKQEEKQISQTPIHLLSTITVDEGRYALLQLGKKKRGVYNLSDLELISQLIQQTQLTLNVLSLLSREKDLIQQTYEANLTALRSQINPHFLFNTLNSIGELVHESAELAEQAVEKLAFIFRYTLNKSSENYVALGEEMKLIRTYLEMEKIRFGERLEMHIEIRDNMQDVQIPSFVLLTLVENTIKHGVSKILHKGEVSVVAFKDDSFLVCEVMDNGPGIDTSRIFKSHGLSNTVSRMENTYDMKDLMDFENTGDGTLVRVRFPLDKQPQLKP